mgnify:CR=1 FL=1
MSAAPPIESRRDRLLTAANISHKSKRILAQTRGPASEIALSAPRAWRRHQHSRVTVPLVATQASRLREQGASRAGRPEDAVRPGAALCEGTSRGEGCREVAGACVRDYMVTTSVLSLITDMTAM